MSFTALVQLYAPLAGLLAVVFWLGVLSQRVRQLETRVKDLSVEDVNQTDERDRLIRVEVKLEALSESVKSLDRGMQGVQRQLGNMVGEARKAATHD